VIAVTYHLGAAITLVVPPEDVVILDQLVDEALAGALDALAEAGSSVELIGPAYLVDEDEVAEVTS
jgi:hypothetical protein